jgi:isopentenyl-diphosphate delta-isomerase type 1
MDPSENEMLDIVNADGKVIGTASRSDCHSNPDLAHRAVHVFFRNSRNEILLQKRSRKKRVQPGKWDTSVGGHLDPGETYEEAAKRETLEELGVDIGSQNLELVHMHDYIWRTEIETEHIRTYICKYDGPFEFNRDEITALRFWSVEELSSARGNGTLTPNLEEELIRLGFGI